MARMKQCIAWDGRMLAMLENDTVSEHGRIYYASRQRFDRLSAADIDGAALGKVVLAALSTPGDVRAIEQLLEKMTLPEFIEFYRRAISMGIVTSSFRFLFMAVIENPPEPNSFPRFGSHYAIAIRADGDNMVIYYSVDYDCLAIGQDAYAAMLLMKEGRSATDAVTAQSVLSSDESHWRMKRHGVSYDAVTGEYTHTSSHEAGEQYEYLPMFRVCVAPKTQKQLEEDD